MKKEKACPICGSKQIMLYTPFVELNTKGEYVPKQTVCCNAQKKNMEYKARFVNPEDLEDES